ncbi:MAG: hypothetical protein K2I76_01005, partial [Malacoplasma sp.]|nr:hypothetical protein [Malacoplasma sp.]
YFLNHNLDCFDFSFYQMQNKFKFNKIKWNKINEIFALKSKFENDFPFFTNFLFQEKIEKFNEINWELFLKALKVWTKNNIIENLTNLPRIHKELLKKAIHVANLKRRPKIYDYLSTYELVLKLVFPIWVARPETVSLYIPLEKNYFEYGIYDEASQMFLERAYPLLYRSRINMVAGDDKQLKPTDFFTSRDDEEESEIDDLDQQESLLDRAKSSSWNELMLQNHYRSQSKELIEFSSNYIYDKKLNYASKNGKQNFKALKVINVNGNFINSKNIEEAKYVIKILKENVNNYKSILVITFNSVQSSYISSLLINSKETDPEITNKYLSQEIEVVNLENVQGNEADLVIMSIGYGRKNDDQKIRATFGALIQDGGKNRLNVAITRSKLKMIVLKSLSASDIKSSANQNLMIFKEFLAYLDNIEMNRKKEEESIKRFDTTVLDELNKTIFNDVYKIVYPHNLSLIPNYNVGNKTIDIAIVNPSTNTVVLGLLIEKWNLKISEFDKLKILDDQKFLEARGYKILRIM